MAKIIIFDMGGVLSSADNAILAVEKTLLEKTGVNLFPIKGQPSPRYKELSEGTITPKEYFQNLLDLSKVKISAEKLMDAYKQAYCHVVKFDSEMIKLVKSLRKAYKLALLSDTNEFHWQINKGRGLDKLFDVCFTSSGLGVTKNEARAFEIVTKKLKIKPEDCIFIDDKEGHVARAKSIGIDAIQFKSYEQLVSELNARNII